MAFETVKLPGIIGADEIDPGVFCITPYGLGFRFDAGGNRMIGILYDKPVEMHGRMSWGELTRADALGSVIELKQVQIVPDLTSARKSYDFGSGCLIGSPAGYFLTVSSARSYGSAMAVGLDGVCDDRTVQGGDVWTFDAWKLVQYWPDWTQIRTVIFERSPPEQK